MNTRSSTRSAAASLLALAAANNTATHLAKRWMLLTQRMAPRRLGATYPFSTLECDIMFRLFCSTWRDPRAAVDITNFETVNAFMTRIAVYVIKFYGTSYSEQDRMLVLWLNNEGFGEHNDFTEEAIERELQTIEILHPYVLNLWDTMWEEENQNPNAPSA